MEIILNDTGKKYLRKWVFKHLSFHFHQGKKYAITGENGSGKSTLLKIISGFLTPTTGEIHCKINQTSPLPDEHFFKHMTMAAPYLELLEEFTLAELLKFHFQFKNLQEGLTLIDVARQVGLENNMKKTIKWFSSGMKQRLKLALAINTESSVVLLDEPFSHLDKKGISIIRDLILADNSKRIFIIASNDPEEYNYCDEELNLHDFKPVRREGENLLNQTGNFLSK